MNVSDMQVPGEDDRHDEQSRSQTIKANNKIVKERIWISPVTSKIETQPLDTDIDAQLHKECDVRLGFKTRNVPSEMRTSWKLFGVAKFRKR